MWLSEHHHGYFLVWYYLLVIRSYLYLEAGPEIFVWKHKRAIPARALYPLKLSLYTSRGRQGREGVREGGALFLSLSLRRLYYLSTGREDGRHCRR